VPDFVAVGHVTLDHFPDGVRPGGAALYAAVTAQRLGLSAGILTSHAADFPLDAIPPQIEVVSLEARETTAFEHGPGGNGRALRVTAAARALGPADVPEDWRDAGLVLLAPVLNEVDPAVASAFPDASVAAAVQGWLRGLGRDGQVVSRPWMPSPDLLERLQALFASTEDIRGHEQEVLEWVQRLPLAVITAGAAGALLYVNGYRYEVPPRPAREVDETGPGDVFAAAFLIDYHRNGDPWEAAAIATCAASLSVEGPGWSAVPDATQLAREVERYRRARD
jgi:sugar/nucleoside kinase (ribokinase family)